MTKREQINNSLLKFNFEISNNKKYEINSI